MLSHSSGDESLLLFPNSSNEPRPERRLLESDGDGQCERGISEYDGEGERNGERCNSSINEIAAEGKDGHTPVPSSVFGCFDMRIFLTISSYQGPILPCGPTITRQID